MFVQLKSNCSFCAFFSVANCFMWDQSHKETCTELRRKRFQGYSRFEASSCPGDFSWFFSYLLSAWMSKCQVSFCEALPSLWNAHFSADLFWRGPLSVRIQILYANEGECRKEADMETVPQGDKTNCLPHKGHEFIPTLYHFPSNCEACSKPLWHVFKPPPALECRRCHVKCHKDHLDKKEDVIAPCKGKVYRLWSKLYWWMNIFYYILYFLIHAPNK